MAQPCQPTGFPYRYRMESTLEAIGKKVQLARMVGGCFVYEMEFGI